MGRRVFQKLRAAPRLIHEVRVRNAHLSLCLASDFRKICEGKNVLAMLAIRCGFIGAGRMATALARGFVRSQIVSPDAVLASDPSEAARHAFLQEVPGSNIGTDNRAVASGADVLLLAVKPQQMTAALAEIRPAIQSDSLVVSIAAGVTLDRLAAGLPAGQRIVRVMPNTPCLLGSGASGYSLGPHAAEEDGVLVSKLLSSVGAAFEVPESLLDAVTGLSGSGPAFVYSMIEALAEGGVAAGLPPQLAAELAARTVAGAADMVLQTGDSPAVLRDRVTSPGGTTQAGLAVLAERGFGEAVAQAVAAATRRSAELGRSN
jgi:pyrroline-5-carboxylate reductase